MANTITKNNSFGEVLDALKLKGVKACRECWLDNYYIYFNEEEYIIKDTDGDESEYFDAEDLFTEDWTIIYPN